MEVVGVVQLRVIWDLGDGTLRRQTLPLQEGATNEQIQSVLNSMASLTTRILSGAVKITYETIM